MATVRFEWDPTKDLENQAKHGVSFSRAQHAFADRKRVIAEDLTHGASERRYYCFGALDGGILTVRFTFRARVVRIYGAGFWRKGKQIYARRNKVHE